MEEHGLSKKVEISLSTHAGLDYVPPHYPAGVGRTLQPPLDQPLTDEHPPPHYQYYSTNPTHL
ncbi:hypothetical protein ACE6H2_024304 [Prunus campanulata]